MEMPSTQRKELAQSLDVNEQYLYQCLTGRREMGALEAVRVEQESGGVLRRWHVCSRTWHRIWPELVGQPGAPVPGVRDAGAVAREAA
jgi:hypothetical protein